MRVLLMILSLALVACTQLPPLPEAQGGEGAPRLENARIVDLRSGEVLTPAQLIARLASADRLLVGERHDNVDHHRLQAWLVEALAHRRGEGVVLMEMLNPDQQPKVDAVERAYGAGSPPADPSLALAWQDGWDWALYGPLVTGFLRQGVPLLAANLDKSEIMGIYRAPIAVEGRKSTAPAVQAALRETIRQAHCDLLPASQLPAMLVVQQHRDRRMAERLLAAPAPAVLLAGGFHVRKDLGVPLHLEDLAPGKGFAVLLLAETGEPVDASQADYVWFTPAMAAQDHCAELRSSRR